MQPIVLVPRSTRHTSPKNQKPNAVNQGTKPVANSHCVNLDMPLRLDYGGLGIGGLGFVGAGILEDEGLLGLGLDPYVDAPAGDSMNTIIINVNVNTPVASGPRYSPPTSFLRPPPPPASPSPPPPNGNTTAFSDPITTPYRPTPNTTGAFSDPTTTPDRPKPAAKRNKSAVRYGVRDRDAEDRDTATVRVGREARDVTKRAADSRDTATMRLGRSSGDASERGSSSGRSDTTTPNASSVVDIPTIKLPSVIGSAIKLAPSSEHGHVAVAATTLDGAEKSKAADRADEAAARVILLHDKHDEESPDTREVKAPQTEAHESSSSESSGGRESEELKTRRRRAGLKYGERSGTDRHGDLEDGSTEEIVKARATVRTARQATKAGEITQARAHAESKERGTPSAEESRELYGRHRR